MSIRVSPRWSALCLIALLTLAAPYAVALAGQRVVNEPKPAAVNIVRQAFPAAKEDPNDITKSDSAWEIEWAVTDGNDGYEKPIGKKKSNGRPGSSVLVIRSAKFMYKDQYGNPRWITVVKNLLMGEMFVPYDTTSPTFYDIARFSFGLVTAKKEYLGPTCVAPGEVLQSKNPRDNNKVHKEVHDDGLRWLNRSGKARRGEKLILWSILSAGNYRYIMEYNFHDDGMITCRVGPTAHNFYNRQENKRDIHLHVGCWRFDVELSDPNNPKNGGPNQNAVYVARRKPVPKKPGHFRLDVQPFNADENDIAREGFTDWVAKEFTYLRVQSTVRKNSSGKPMPIGYDVLPLRYGSVRDYPNSQDFVNHDFWVTHAEKRFHTYEQVPSYAKEKRSLQNQAVRIWHNSALVHTSRGEDFGTDGQTSGQGVAITSWTGFILRPRNLFDSTPLYPVAVTVPRGKVIKKEKAKLVNPNPEKPKTDKPKNDKPKTDKPKTKGKTKQIRFQNVHTIKMTAGRVYTIDMVARFDTYLRLENADGVQLATDDDGGFGLNARIVHRPTKDGEYRIIATSYRPNTTGEYTLTVYEHDPTGGQ